MRYDRMIDHEWCLLQKFLWCDVWVGVCMMIVSFTIPLHVVFCYTIQCQTHSFRLDLGEKGSMEGSECNNHGGEVQVWGAAGDHWRGMEENLSHTRQVPTHRIHLRFSHNHFMVRSRLYNPFMAKYLTVHRCIFVSPHYPDADAEAEGDGNVALQPRT